MHAAVTLPGLRVPAPPPLAARFRSDSLDEVRSFIARTDGEHSRVVHGSGSLRFELATIGGSGVALAWGGIALPHTVRGELRHPVVHVSLGAGCRYVFGRREIEVPPGAAVVLPPGREFTRRSSAGRIFAIMVDRELLVGEMTARLGDGTEEWAIGIHRFDVHGAYARALESAIADWTDSLDSAIAAATRRSCEARVISALADSVLGESSVAPVSHVAAGRIADLEAWIESNLAEPITLGRLCEFSGMGQRALQLAFHARWGLSPMRFVAERRLAAAHRLLARAGPDNGVTGIAMGVGFSHLGRFAAMYRRAYGESPSQTLRR